MLLKIKDLNFSYSDKEIFCSFDLNAPAGKIIHINGPSGAGKTTLLHLIAGIQSPQSGVITLGEEVFFNNKQIKIEQLEKLINEKNDEDFDLIKENVLKGNKNNMPLWLKSYHGR